MYVMLKSSRSQLIVFFLLSFVIAWGTWIPSFLLPSFPKSISVIGLFAPAISALITAMLSSGKKGMSEILTRYFIFRFKPQWYILAIFLMPVIYLLAVMINVSFFHYTSPIWTNLPAYFIVASFIWLMFINSGEEIGWRGFALPVLLQNCKNPIKASLLLGTVWGLWHLPLYLLPGQSSFPYILFLLLTIGLSFIYTFLFLATKGSLLSVIMLHAGTDVGARIFQLAHFTPTMYGTIDVLVYIVAGILIYFFKKSKASNLPN